MRFQTKMHIIGARYYDIADDKTGEIKRFISIFAIQKMEADKADRVGFEPSKVRCSNSEVVRKLAALTLPADVDCEAELSVNGKGEAKVIVHDIKLPESIKVPEQQPLQATPRRAA